MADTTQKKSTRSASTRSAAGKKSGSSRAKQPPQPQKRPIRREVWGCVLALLALCTVVSYFGVSALFLDWFATLLKGLFGYGYWVVAPAMVLASATLLFHRGRPVTARVTASLLLPLVFGTLGHILLCKEAFVSSLGVVPLLWTTGNALTSGGVVSGALAIGSVAVIAAPTSIALFSAVFVLLAVISGRWIVRAIAAKRRERPRYEYEEEPELPEEDETPKRRQQARAHPQIDIPLDGEEPPAPPERKEREGRFTSFFRHKSDRQKTPAQVLTEEEKTPAIPDGDRPVAAAFTASAAPAPAPLPVTEPPAPTAEQPLRAEKRESAPVPAPLAAEPAAVEPAPAKKEKVTLAREVAAQTAAVTAEIEEKLAGEEEGYEFPPITLLHEGEGENHIEAGAELRNNSRRLAETLSSFGVDATPGDVIHGPSVTRYEFTLDQGVKLSKITNLQDDIALALGASGVRIAPIPDKISVVGIEVPNKHVTPVLIRDVIDSRDFKEHKSKTAFALGRDIAGRNVIGNIEKLPHVLIAGTTGSGKSVCTNSLIISLLYKSTPDEVRFIMVDPKMVELAPYNGIPHLLIPVVTDPKKAAGALQWAVFEMMKRYKTFSENGVKKLEEFNKLARATEGMETLPSVVVVIDELADLMLVAAKEVEESICRVAQMGRAAGVHLVIATQRPSADVITGLMKANIPSRIAFAVASSLESRIILDNTGAEKLVGKGDMLYAPLGGGKPTRVQGCFISPEEIEQVVEFVKRTGEANYSDEVIAKIEESVQEKEKGGGKAAPAADPGEDEGDELLPAAVDVVLETGQASVSMLQRRLKLGYSRAARLVDQMEDRGIVGPFEGSKPRQLLITRAQWQEMQMGGAEPGGAEAPASGEEA